METTRNMDKMVDFYRKIWKEASDLLSAEFFELEPGFWKIGYKSQFTFINNFKVQLDDPVLMSLAGNKPLCFRMLRDANLPVPEYETFRFDQIEKALHFMNRFPGEYFVVKPSLATSGGRGVTTHIHSGKDCFHAAANASLYSSELLIERFFSGEPYRFLVLDGKVIHVSRRRGVRIVGNGKSTIGKILDQVRDSERVKGSRKKTKSDPDLNATLRHQGLGKESVLKEGEEILAKSYGFSIQRYSDLRTHFDENVTGSVCDELLTTAVKATKALNLSFAGVDMVTVNSHLPLEKSGGIINEVNTTPGLHHHYNLINGSDTLPAVKVLEYLLGIKS